MLQEELPAGGTGEEVEEFELGYRDDRGFDNSGGLADGLMEVFREQEAAFVVEECPGGEDGVGVAGAGELKGLSDIFGEDELVLECVPKVELAQNLLGRLAVGRMLGVGDGNTADGRTTQILERFDGTGGGPKADAAGGVGAHGAGQKQSGGVQFSDKLFICREIDIERGAAADLAGEHTGGTEGPSGVGAGVEGEFGLEGGEVGGGGDREGLCVSEA